ncbi:hypothetical protein H2248_008052 [Termitomyces sp. 'cryptogamus']|nr:hypothetical protein H2248_008052 [Termitomyces sp. 'cryptogamus']
MNDKTTLAGIHNSGKLAYLALIWRSLRSMKDYMEHPDDSKRMLSVPILQGRSLLYYWGWLIVMLFTTVTLRKVAEIDFSLQNWSSCY